MDETRGSAQKCAQCCGDVLRRIAFRVDGVLRPVCCNDVAHAVRLTAAVVHRQHRREVVLVGQAEEPLAAVTQAGAMVQSQGYGQGQVQGQGQGSRPRWRTRSGLGAINTCGTELELEQCPTSGRYRGQLQRLDHKAGACRHIQVVGWFSARALEQVRQVPQHGTPAWLAAHFVFAIHRGEHVSLKAANMVSSKAASWACCRTNAKNCVQHRADECQRGSSRPGPLVIARHTDVLTFFTLLCTCGAHECQNP